jgi:hypothetical protein
METIKTEERKTQNISIRLELDDAIVGKKYSVDAHAFILYIVEKYKGKCIRLKFQHASARQRFHMYLRDLSETGLFRIQDLFVNGLSIFIDTRPRNARYDFKASIVERLPDIREAREIAKRDSNRTRGSGRMNSNDDKGDSAEDKDLHNS